MAVTVTVAVAVTAVVVTSNVALVAPDGTMTLAGTVAGPELTRTTEVPPAGAAASRVTVPVAVPPPTMLVGETATDTRFGAGAPAVTFRVAN